MKQGTKTGEAVVLKAHVMFLQEEHREKQKKTVGIAEKVDKWMYVCEWEESWRKSYLVVAIFAWGWD